MIRVYCGKRRCKFNEKAFKTGLGQCTSDRIMLDKKGSNCVEVSSMLRKGHKIKKNEDFLVFETEYGFLTFTKKKVKS